MIKVASVAAFLLISSFASAQGLVQGTTYDLTESGVSNGTVFPSQSTFADHTDGGTTIANWIWNSGRSRWDVYVNNTLVSFITLTSAGNGDFNFTRTSVAFGTVTTGTLTD
ncbi:MAG TPA: hypothetical protein PKA88_37130 [Polyangiaceae bacterium]|nr:hypothetical protein [Polyangiaceae bacterium]